MNELMFETSLNIQLYKLSNVGTSLNILTNERSDVGTSLNIKTYK